MKKKKTEFEKSPMAELARRLNVEPEYINAAHKPVVIRPGVIRAVLSAMGYRLENDLDALAWLKRLDHTECERTLPPVLVLRHELQPAQIPVNVVPESHSHNWRLVREDGEVTEEGSLEIRRSTASNHEPADEDGFGTSSVALKVELPCGYHRFQFDDESMPLIVVPAKCWLGPINRGQKIWGVDAQLYLLRSERNWGIGDFTDLCNLIDIAAGWGASVVGLNPLHALFIEDPEHASPYEPASRLHLNILNIDVTAIPEFATAEDAKSLLKSEDFTSALNAVRAEDIVNYRAVTDLKLMMLGLIYSHFTKEASIERRQSLKAFVESGGESLSQFCIFQAIRLDVARRHGAADDLQQWPEELREPDSPGIRGFAASHREEINFLVWLQWIADTQLRDAARRAEARGMTVGLYRDLAIGSSAAGAEVWSNPDVVVGKAHAGAPPDILNPAGQDWSLPPFNPRILRESGYAPFIELVRANMRYCGALRIDHVVGLQHLYWVPAGHKPHEGAYVTYPFNDLAGILALESQRNHCLVVGEDLGTVPPGFSEKLNEHGVLSYRVLYFGQNSESGQFVPPDGYRRLALGTVGSHDLATLKGWWLDNDIALREQHGLYPDRGEGDRQRKIRDKEKRQLLAALRMQGLEPGKGDDFVRLSRAVHAFLARSGAAITMVQLENLTGEVSQTNLPATSKEHPNWRRRLSKSLEHLNRDATAASIIEAIRCERPRF
jgi:4-alpha-glucanotransferase